MTNQIVASVAIEQLVQRRWALLQRGLLRVQQELGNLIDVNKLKIKEEGDRLNLIYTKKEGLK